MSHSPEFRKVAIPTATVGHVRSTAEALAHAESSHKESVMSRPTRDQILELSMQYLLESGPAAFEAKELARRGWFQPSQVNYYFGSKRDLIAVAANTLFLRHIDNVIEKVEAHSDPREGLQAWCDAIIAFNTANGATAALVAFPRLFLPETESSPERYIDDSVLDSSERVGAVLLSVMYAIARGRPYRRLNRARVAAVAITMPRVTTSVVMVGLSAAGLAQVWEQHLQKPIFGFDPRKAFLRGVRQIAGDLTNEPAPALADDDFS